ncbi:MAG: tetratricopeptide repeat protein [Spirochaetes bacterium]|nr:tetratricopeptide repeat protein [Spirochaetota bacterium]
MTFKNEKIKNDLDLVNLINSSLDLLKIGEFNRAIISFNNALKQNYSNLIAESGIKCCKYWIARLNKFNNLNESYKKGKTLLEEWFKFENFIQTIKNIQSKVTTNIMHFIFNTALDEFKKVKLENKIFDLDITFNIALCYKKIGNYTEAIKNLAEAMSYENDNSNVMCQLADCYALIDEEKKAKLLFREAFFIDPSSIELNLLDSNIINYIIAKIKDYKISSNEINYWIPVYGRILGILNIYRELLPIEAAKIKKEILSIENNFGSTLDDDNILKSKLLNLCLWYYDFVKYYKKDKSDLSEIEYKIKNTSEHIYNIFFKNMK